MTPINVAVAELHYLESHFGNRAQVASLLDVDKSSVTRWFQGKGVPEAKNEDRIAALRHIALRLARVFQPPVAIEWLQGVNGFLGNHRPIDFIRDGRISEVLAAIEQTDAGAYV